jgi:NADPH:quinone reductase-like Zn-dependent oxidoreductase
MRRYEFASFGLDQLKIVEREDPSPGPGEVVLDVEAFSLNYRDLLVVKALQPEHRSSGDPGRRCRRHDRRCR